jgi:hypothetical protein
MIVARGRVLMERGWMTERSEMVIPRGSAMRDVAACPRAEGGAVGGDSGAFGDAREAAEGRLESRCDACPVHDPAQNPFQDIVAHRGLCG